MENNTFIVERMDRIEDKMDVYVKDNQNLAKQIVELGTEVKSLASTTKEVLMFHQTTTKELLTFLQRLLVALFGALLLLIGLKIADIGVILKGLLL